MNDKGEKIWLVERKAELAVLRRTFCLQRRDSIQAFTATHAFA